MGICCSGYTYTAVAIACEFDISRFFARRFRKGLAFTGFDETKMFQKKFKLGELRTPEERAAHANDKNSRTNNNAEITLKDIIYRNMFVKIYEFFKTNDYKPFTKLNHHKILHLSAELSRSFVAYMIKDMQVYNGETNPFLSKDTPLSKELFDEFKTKILTVSDDQVLDPESQDDGVVRAIEIRIILDILEDLGTYNVGFHMTSIYKAMDQNEQNKKNNVNPQRVDRLVYGTK